MSVMLSTTEYQFAHGKMPKGGDEWSSWAFFFDKETEPRWFKGKYGVAKKAALKKAKEENVSRVKVGS